MIKMQKLIYRVLIPHKYTHTTYNPYHECNETFNINNWLGCDWKVRQSLADKMKAEYKQIIDALPIYKDFKKNKYKIQLGYVTNKSTKNIDLDGFYMCHKYFQDCVAKKCSFNDSVKRIPDIALKYLGMREDDGDEELWAEVIEISGDDIPRMPTWMLKRYGMYKEEDII